MVAPFSDVLSFHEEYKIYCAENYTSPEDVACLTVFTEAFKHLHKTTGVRLHSSKGAFNTCEICNNAKELLRNKRMNISIIVIIIFFGFIIIFREDL